MFADEIARRRTLAIISHPDAGKTTLTEKLLLYGGAVQLAGSVTARKSQRATTSDWMELERQRGISISSTVLQFDYNGYRLNLLDTPGHKDFSEDTYRVLTAVDAVIMIIDAGKGIEPQTLKLFEICRRRGIPIFTFMNKLDRPAREPLDLLDELERILGLHVFAMNWPLGNGKEFRGVFDRVGQAVHLFERTPHGAYHAPVAVSQFEDATVRLALGNTLYAQCQEELSLLAEAGAKLDITQVHSGHLSPVFFGSAANNFGVQMLLDAFLQYAVTPQPRKSGTRKVLLEQDAFSGFVFKIQANMDPRHRDRIAFVRVCSGKFTRDMSVIHVQSGRKVRLSSSHKLFGRDRETLDEAYPGDVIGLVGHDEFGIGDTLTEDPAIVYHEIPQFLPECFAYIHSTNTSQFKRFREGLDQLLREGVTQALQVRHSHTRLPLLAAVGPLQFEVMQYRLQSEYGAETRFEKAPWEVMRWLDPNAPSDQVEQAVLYKKIGRAVDARQHPVLLFPDQWALKYFQREHADLTLYELPPVQ